MKTARVIPAALLLLALSGCGNKGPLVMPAPPAADAQAVDDAGAVADPTPADDAAGVTPFPQNAEPAPQAEPLPEADGEPDPVPDPPVDGG